MRYKTVRTETRQVEEIRNVSANPKYKIGDYIEVYCGQYEGHNFYVKDVRYNLDRQCFEYLYDGVLMGGWYGETSVVPV